MKVLHSTETSVTLPVDAADIQSTLSRPVGGPQIPHAVIFVLGKTNFHFVAVFVIANSKPHEIFCIRHDL